MVPPDGITPADQGGGRLDQRQIVRTERRRVHPSCRRASPSLSASAVWASRRSRCSSTTASGARATNVASPSLASILPIRSEERRVGEEGVRTCRSRGAPEHEKKK